jgi:hypothetical protein
MTRPLPEGAKPGKNVPDVKAAYTIDQSFLHQGARLPVLLGKVDGNSVRATRSQRDP